VSLVRGAGSLLIAALLLAARPPSAEVLLEDPYPSVLEDTSGLYTRVTDPELPEASIEFVARDGNLLRAFTYRASAFEPDSGPILFVLHGESRTAESALRSVKPIGERHAALVVAPEFPESLYGPDADPYLLGVGTSGQPGSEAFDPAEWRAPEDYLYSELEHLFEALRIELGGRQTTYRVFGHGGGGQFVHRLLTFRADARVSVAVAANAGWYTLPSDGGGSDANFAYPYGLFATPVGLLERDALLGSELVVLLGELDTDTPAEDPDLRNTPEANHQGESRLERGHFYFELGEDVASAAALPFGWLVDVVPGVGHSRSQMAPSAGWYLFRDPATSPCAPSSAAEAGFLAVNEIHADPATGAAGDANRDGVQGPLDDEFVELVNLGSEALCLEGWTLGDADPPENHRFPIGSRLAPGQVLLVFGGGVPTGDFAGALVQWAAFGQSLSLSNGGDVLELRDAEGALVHAVSWGDCAKQPCAAEHIAMSLSLDASVTRDPPFSGPFLPHDAVSEGPYSPGTPLPEPLPPLLGAAALASLAGLGARGRVRPGRL